LKIRTVAITKSIPSGVVASCRRGSLLDFQSAAKPQNPDF
jgi:hypothetical protein